MTPPRYFKLRGRAGRPFYIETDGLTTKSRIGPIITGRKVGPNGERFANNIVILTAADLAAVTELEMDLHYAMLVPLGTAKLPLKRGGA